MPNKYQPHYPQRPSKSDRQLETDKHPLTTKVFGSALRTVNTKSRVKKEESLFYNIYDSQ